MKETYQVWINSRRVRANEMLIVSALPMIGIFIISISFAKNNLQNPPLWISSVFLIISYLLFMFILFKINSNPRLKGNWHKKIQSNAYPIESDKDKVVDTSPDKLFVVFAVIATTLGMVSFTPTFLQLGVSFKASLIIIGVCFIGFIYALWQWSNPQMPIELKKESD